VAVGKPRGRFDIVCVWGDAYVRFTSDPKRSVPPKEIVKSLREYIGYIEAGVKAEPKEKTKP
jgi:hypothetical protein